MIQRTDIAGPSAPQIINLTCHSQDAIYLQWKRPTTFYNSIDFYVINYKESSYNSYQQIQLNTTASFAETSVCIEYTFASKSYESFRDKFWALFTRALKIRARKHETKKRKSWKEKHKPIKDYCYPVTSLSPNPFQRGSSQLCTIEKIHPFNSLLLVLFIFSCFVQIIIQNLTTYSVYSVNVQAASLSAINPRRILLGLHSASRKVNAPFLYSEASRWAVLIIIFLSATSSGAHEACAFYASYQRRLGITSINYYSPRFYPPPFSFLLRGEKLILLLSLHR